MGTAGSSNRLPPPPNVASVPLRGQEEEIPTYGHPIGTSYIPEYTNENIRQRTRSNAFGRSEEPRSQGPSPYQTLRNDDWMNPRPSAPSLSNLRSSRQETLLTYAAQMTGWQTSAGHDPSFPQHQDVMELSRIISQLAMANQQLASAHNVTLAHLESLYVELKKERESRRARVPADVEALDEALRKRLTGVEDEEDDEDDDNEETEESRVVDSRIGRLENPLVENLNTRRIKQRNLRRDEGRKLRARIERLESLAAARGFNDIESCPGVDEGHRAKNGYSSLTESCQTDLTCVVDGRVFSNAERLVPELESKTQPLDDRREAIDDADPTKSARNVGFGDEKSNGLSTTVAACSNVNLHLEKSEEEERRDDAKMDLMENTRKSEMFTLSEEIERLKAERLEYQTTNERLLGDLAQKNMVIENLTKDSGESKARCEQVESRLQERAKEFDKLVENFGIVKKETERLAKVIDAFNLEKDTAETRISSLEQELAKSLLEKEEIKKAESQKVSKLRAELSEEISDKKEQIKALEDALDEIRRLKETIKTEKKSSGDEASKEDIVVDEAQDGPAADCTSNIEEFRKELILKRETRQRAIAAVSSEMERLKRELDAEKEAHSETSKVLDLLRSAQNADFMPQGDSSESDGSFGKSMLKDQWSDEQELTQRRKEAQTLTSLLKVSDELRNDVRFQIEKVDDLRYHLETLPDKHRYRIRCLTDVTNKTREAVYARERRANELKDHLAQILVRLGDRSFLDLPDDVGLECGRQLENINSLKALYNERLKVLTELKEAAIRELADVKERLDHSSKKSECLEEDLRKADEKIDAQDTEISNLESQLGLTKADCRDLQNQMSLINGLFTQMLLGASSADMDLDRLTQLLQENHDLISDMAREGSTEAAALPKLLLDLVEQVEGGKGSLKRTEGEGNGSDGEVEKKEDDLQQEDIAHNLPKVWRVLLELLSCHAEGTPTVSVASCSDPNSCYKSVDTPAGPTLVISVSKTYIRLKELILEKKSLEKEMNRMKQLNTHLESKLGEQEKRLSTVSAELSKTWTIVDRMQAQHQQLHTHEKILRYELQQKRKMLQELKQELEYCREKWESARQKNTNTEMEWRSLRREFAARKALAAHDSFNNSAESGFSDERGDDTDEEENNAVEGRIRLGPRRKPRKESPRAPTPDTESEQPTDTELSESKTESSATLEQRTPTPETEAEADDIADANLITGRTSRAVAPLVSQGSQESLDPLDQALTNVIQNLIGIHNESDVLVNSSFDSPYDTTRVEETNAIEDPLELQETYERNPNLESESSNLSNDSKLSQICGTVTAELLSIPDAVSTPNATSTATMEDTGKMSYTDGEKSTAEESPISSVSHVPTVTSTVTSTIGTMSVFSIGPFLPSNLTPSTIKNVQFSDPLIVGPSNRLFTPVFGTPMTDVAEDTDNGSAFSSPFDSSSSSSLSTKSLETESKDPEERPSKSTESIVDSDELSMGSFSSVETVKEFSAVDDPSPSTSFTGVSQNTAIALPQVDSSCSKQEQGNVSVLKSRTPEEARAAREDRLRRLEEQADWLMKKMNATSRRGSALSTRLEELHEAYGEPPVPPPMPDVLPNDRLRTNLPDLPRQIPDSSSTEVKENIEAPVSRRRSGESPSNSAP